MNINFSTRILLAALLLHVTACSYIKSLFPDKEKDYQYTAEIPPLNLPADLKKKPTSPVSESRPVEDSNPSDIKPAMQTPAEATATGTDSAPVAQNEEEAPPPIETVEKYENISLELIRFNDGENRLRLGAEKARVWRMVSKALSRKSIEVTNRNQDDAFFVVQFDPDEKKVEDGSLWDEAVFMFRGFQADEQEYVLKLEEQDRHTEVIILDKDQKPLPPDDKGGLALLTLIQSTIATDLANK
ncbi:MAG: outer membrane protein assembly factor BamC [Methylococcaceae bacterium]|nr:outer membrane protein assembly factor BamC [Methylococcaceae bacterium]